MSREDGAGPDGGGRRGPSLSGGAASQWVWAGGAGGPGANEGAL